MKWPPVNITWIFQVVPLKPLLLLGRWLMTTTRWWWEGGGRRIFVVKAFPLIWKWQWRYAQGSRAGDRRRDDENMIKGLCWGFSGGSIVETRLFIFSLKLESFSLSVGRLANNYKLFINSFFRLFAQVRISVCPPLILQSPSSVLFCLWN